MSSQKEISYEMLFAQIDTYIKKPESVAMIKKAYEFAQEQHKDQKRKSGQPYFIHCLNVAYILASIQAGPQTICAGFLHDTIEDCGVSFETIKEEFDEEVAVLVQAVSKISKLDFSDSEEYQAANHRKLFIAMAKDIRVIIIKLVDRLHNMRTLQYLNEDKQKRIASETLQVYAPIAHRLGLAEIKNELEDLCFLYLNKEKYHEIASLVEKKKSERTEIVGEMIDNLNNLLNEHHFNFRIFGRSKHLYSIYNKMITKNKRFDEIFDLYAIRIVTDTELACYEILGYIHAAYKPVSGRLKDYIAVPKMNMYQSLHTTILNQEGNIFEIQIRTEKMDAIAEKGIAAHWAYKEGTYNSANEQKEIENKLGWFKDMVSIMDESELEQPSDFMQQITKDIFEANVYVMSPKGRIIELPNGSTPLDFAYRIHTDVGHNTIGAIVNGALVPLNTVLKTGDVVNIKTSKQSTGPSEDWLKIVKTATARNKIKAYLIKKADSERAELVEKGERILIEELRKRNLDEKEYMDKSHLESLYGNWGINNYQELMYAIASKSVNLIQVVDKLSKPKTSNLLDNLSFTKFFQSRTAHRQTINSTGVSVGDIDSMKVTMAGCCKPIFGDEIVGYITKGSGVTIHRRDCPNIVNEKNRLIDAKWIEDVSNAQYETWLRIDATDRNYLLVDISTMLAQFKISLLAIDSEVLPDKVNVYVNIKISVKDIEQLNMIISNLKKVESIKNVSRIIK